MDQLIVALDTDDDRRALYLADRLHTVAGAFKVGLQLFTAHGPALVRELVNRGHRVFLDLKFHDIPNTVAGAVAAAVDLGVWMMNVHASGGSAMLRAARAAADARASAPARPPLLIAVTVLTSLDAPTLSQIGVAGAPIEVVERWALIAARAGLNGIVASPRETAHVRRVCGPTFLIVTPGIRGPSDPPDDQQRTMSIREALEAGASYVVVGRPITSAADPAGAAERLVDEART